MRRVPKDWEHPRRLDGTFQPLYDVDFNTACEQWKEAFYAWERRDAAYFHFGADDNWMFNGGVQYWEYVGNPPDRHSCRPQWSDAERTHFQLYDADTDGTPISPVIESPEALAHWLTENTKHTETLPTYEEWLSFCRGEDEPTLADRAVT